MRDGARVLYGCLIRPERYPVRVRPYHNAIQAQSGLIPAAYGDDQERLIHISQSNRVGYLSFRPFCTDQTFLKLFLENART